jgi:hypothetical protein
MGKRTLLAVALLASTLPAAAQQWSVGVGSGAFVFGDFVERTMRAGTGAGPGGSVTMVLTADTRAGLSVDVERALAPRWAVRFEGAFTSSPLAVGQQGDDDSVSVEAGEMDVTTFAAPLVFRINPRGAFRFHLMGGPAYAIYEIGGRSNVSGIVPIDETRREWGVVAGGGVAWWTSERFAVEANLSDIATTSPFEREDFPDVPGFNFPRPHNVHTTVGVRWRF